MKLADSIAIDTNVLVYADDPSSPNHAVAKGYLEKALKGELRICLSHQILAEYFSVITSSKMTRSPLSADEGKERVLFLNRTRRIQKVYFKHSTFKRCAEFCALHDIRGARVFDAFYAMTLLDNHIRQLVTQNTKDFMVFRERGLVVQDLSVDHKLKME